MNVYEWLESMGVQWHSKQLYEVAFTHTSWHNEHRTQTTQDNERLEFLGDSVLQLWTTDQLYHLDPPLSEGVMSPIRRQLVCEKALAGYSRQIGLPRYLRLGVGEEKNGGRDKDSIISDAFEAVLGAIYLDAGWLSARQYLDKVVGPYITHPEATGMIDYKSRLQEYMQSDRRENVEYVVVKSEGASNAPVFTVEARMEDITLGVGQGTSKKRAEQAAARDAIEKLAI